MTTLKTIIRDAYREANLLPINQQPTAGEEQEALRLFNRFLRSVFGNEAGSKYTPYSLGKSGVNSHSHDLPVIRVSGSDYAPLNSKIFCNLDSPEEINLHPNPQDGARFAIQDIASNFSTNNVTLNGNGRRIEGLSSLVLDTDLTNYEWMYREDLGNWQRVSNLEASDEFPFPLEFEDYFIIGLALRINPRNGASIDNQTLMTYRRLSSLFKARYNQVQSGEVDEALLRLRHSPQYLYNPRTQAEGLN